MGNRKWLGRLVGVRKKWGRDCGFRSVLKRVGKYGGEEWVKERVVVILIW